MHFFWTNTSLILNLVLAAAHLSISFALEIILKLSSSSARLSYFVKLTTSVFEPQSQPRGSDNQPISKMKYFFDNI